MKNTCKTGLFLATLLVVSSMSSPVAATGAGSLLRDLGDSNSFVKSGKQTLAPFSHVRFCAGRPDQCQNSSGPDRADMDASRRKELSLVNKVVNSSIRPKNDAPGFDSWDVDVSQGDCDDYALAKRKRLIALGWPPAALRIALARTPSGEGHAVLLVRTSTNDLVLDNRTNSIKDWRSTDLSLVKVQSGHMPRTWYLYASE